MPSSEPMPTPETPAPGPKPADALRLDDRTRGLLLRLARDWVQPR
mgnify:CR=1 FL=1